MKKITRLRLPICIAAALIIAAILVISLLIADTDPQTMIPVSNLTELVIEAENTSVFISAEGRSDLLIERHPARNLHIEEDGSTIIIRTGGRGILQLSLPSWQRLASIKVSTSSGDIAMESFMSENLSISTESGSMMLTGVSSDTIRTDSRSGNMILTDTFSETTSMQNESGFIRAIGILGDVEATTENGSIYIVPIGESTLAAESVSGAISIIAGERSIGWNTSGNTTIYGEKAAPAGGAEDADVKAISEKGSITISK